MGRSVAAALQGRVFLQREHDYHQWWRNFFNGYRFRLTTTNPQENSGKLSLKDGEVFAGTINKSGILSCRTTEFEPSVREGDLVLLYAKPEAPSA